MTLVRAFTRDRSGSAAAELVLTMPIMLVLLLGTAEVAHYFYTEHQVVKGVRDGARYGSRLSFSDANCNGGSPSTLPSARETEIKEITRTGLPSGGTSRVPGWTNSDITVSISCPATAITSGIYNEADNAPQINVSAQVAYPSLIGFLDFSGSNLNASQQSAVMGI